MVMCPSPPDHASWHLWCISMDQVLYSFWTTVLIRSSEQLCSVAEQSFFLWQHAELPEWGSKLLPLQWKLSRRKSSLFSLPRN